MASQTTWTCGVDPGTKVAKLQVSIDGAPAVPFTIKGVCYSPAPLNGSNKDAPAIGDWYWDDTPYATGWKALWARDLPQIRHTLGANAIRIYCSLSRQIPNGVFPNPWDSGQLYTHQNFLDQCWNGSAPNTDQLPMYVLVGIPLPAEMFWKDQYQNITEAEKNYWTGILRETVQAMGQHPAVMGFTIQNEQDGAAVCYGDPQSAQFWWAQAEAMAAIVKSVAPGKLVGMATHDDPQIPTRAAAYMANCPHIDFWGVNTYRLDSFSGLFSDYRNLTGSALKPVILTEFGFPATGHRNPADIYSIYDDATTRSRAATTVGKMLPQAFSDPLGLGVYYFEYCDEWWSQPESPHPYKWCGGPPASDFPNGYWDNEGFGLFSIKRGGALANEASIWVSDGTYNGPNTPIDVHTERTELTAVVSQAFKGA